MADMGTELDLESKIWRLTGAGFGVLFIFIVFKWPSQTSNFVTTIFADDTNLHLSYQNIKSLQTNVAEELDKTDNWMTFIN